MKLSLIKELACEEFGSSFTARSRMRPLVYQRAVYFKLCRDHTKYSLHEIGKTLGYDHATVLHSLKLFEKFELWNETNILKSYFAINDKIGDMCGYPLLTRAEFAKRILNDKINLKGELERLKNNVKNNC